MYYQSQFYHFYRPYLSKVYQSIINGRILFFVGINASGKNILTGQILSKRFKEDFLNITKVHLVLFNFKDNYPPSADQLYQYLITQTAKILNYRLPPTDTYNEFIFYTRMSEMVASIKSSEKIAFVILDAQHILSQGEPFFRSLLYLHQFFRGRLSYILLSEPQILDCQYTSAQMFIRNFNTEKFVFPKTFDRKTILADIHENEKMLKINLKRYYSLIINHSKGLHGAVGMFCRLLSQNPQVRNIRQLSKIIYADPLCAYWIKEVVDSLPRESIRILKEVSNKKESFLKYKKNIYGEWLINLGFLKNNGKLRYPLIKPVLDHFSPQSAGGKVTLRIIDNQFYIDKDNIELTRHEFTVLYLLYKSKGKVVSYDKIGEILWKDTPDSFSLWAISQIISRIRKKLSAYYLNPKTIRSVSKEGYILN